MMKKQVILIIIAAILFAGAIVGASFLLAGKSQQESMDHGAHIASDTEKLNSLVGKEAPDFTLTSYDGKKFNLKDQRGKKVVLFFTEGAMCYPSCWNQIAAFGKNEIFRKDDTVVFSIVVDTKNEWERAIKKMPELASATILHDTSKNV